MKVRLLASALCVALTSGVAHAEYPDRPIRVLVGYSPGGSADLIARLVTGAMSEKLGQPIVIESRPGAGSTIASNALAKAPADGYVLGLATGNIYGVDQTAYSVSYTADDFTPINLLGSYPLILAVNTETGPKSFSEFMDKAKANPGTMFYSSSGIAGSPHTSAVMLQDYMGTEFTHVPFKGGNPALVAVAQGEVDFSMGTAPSVLPLGRGEKVRMLAISSAKRSPIAPELPTIAESGVDGFEYSFWFGLFGPAGLPDDVTQKLFEVSKEVLADPQVQDKLIKIGSEAGTFQSREDFVTFAKENGEFTLEKVNRARSLE
ncbi:Bug family tripartite tricarboxylate transporter substrate binding protein [Orrella marina]|uniref:ABC transporter substrate-binding protein n=1 Tax=Orrella marina TaxID=2163011 RepID=A0A2R4XP42_9BURK|nr:tripartite tricarboxylate transporter substrate binding protein [Orrella marina]AWB35573.1 ABC transporter substrate-binding protein [Orrella marina]